MPVREKPEPFDLLSIVVLSYLAKDEVIANLAIGRGQFSVPG